MLSPINTLHSWLVGGKLENSWKVKSVNMLIKDHSSSNVSVYPPAPLHYLKGDPKKIGKY